MKLTKYNKLQKKAPTGIEAGGMFQIGNLKMKKVMLADLGDGAFTDESIKVKPNKAGDGIVLKCTDKSRLQKGLVKAGFNPIHVKIVKGKKHWIAFLGEFELQTVLSSGSKPAIAAPKPKQLSAPKQAPTPLTCGYNEHGELIVVKAQPKAKKAKAKPKKKALTPEQIEALEKQYANPLHILDADGNVIAVTSATNPKMGKKKIKIEVPF